MTPDELRDSVARSREAQGLRPTIVDVSTLHTVVTVLRPDLPAAKLSRSRDRRAA